MSHSDLDSESAKKSNYDRLIPYKNFRLECEMILFVVDVPASTTQFTHVSGKPNTFNFDFLLEYIFTMSETNGLTKAKLLFNEIPLPSRIFVIDDTPTNKEDNSVSNTDICFMFFTNSFWTSMRINKFLSEQWILKILSTNTHTSPQKQYILLQGYKVHELKRVECPNAKE